MIARSCGTILTWPVCGEPPPSAFAALWGTASLACLFTCAPAKGAASSEDVDWTDPPPQADTNSARPARETARRGPYRNLLMNLMTAGAAVEFGEWQSR